MRQRLIICAAAMTWRPRSSVPRPRFAAPTSRCGGYSCARPRSFHPAVPRLETRSSIARNAKHRDVATLASMPRDVLPSIRWRGFLGRWLSAFRKFRDPGFAISTTPWWPISTACASWVGLWYWPRMTYPVTSLPCRCLRTQCGAS